jgi:hypothetical protein
MAALQDAEVSAAPISEATGHLKTVPESLYQVAEGPTASDAFLSKMRPLQRSRHRLAHLAALSIGHRSAEQPASLQATPGLNALLRPRAPAFSRFVMIRPIQSTRRAVAHTASAPVRGRRVVDNDPDI